jgi:hypothetical protein
VLKAAAEGFGLVRRRPAGWADVLATAISLLPEQSLGRRSVIWGIPSTRARVVKREAAPHLSHRFD